MIIDESRIDKKGLRVSDTYTPDDRLLLEGDSFFRKDLSFSISMVRDSEKIKVTGSFKTEISVRCVKCLEHFDFNINSKFDSILFPLSLADFSYASLKEEEMEYIFYSNGEIDIEKLIIEQVNLNVPLRVVCSDNCKGLCSMCGTNLNYEKCKCSSSIDEINVFNNLK